MTDAANILENVGTSERPGSPLAVVISAGGLGMATARRLGQHHRILIADISGERSQHAANILYEEGYDVTAAACDIVDPASVAAFEALVASDGGFDILAHVVGLSTEEEDWRKMMTVNLIGARRMADAMLRVVKPGGVALFVASSAGHHTSPDEPTIALLDEPLDAAFLDELGAKVGSDMSLARSYALSKLGVIRMCERFAPAWGRKSARIVSLSPGAFNSPMGRRSWKHIPDLKAVIHKATPLAREGTVMEIVDGIEFLTSVRASFITGTDLLIDGGLIAGSLHDPNGLRL